MSQSPKFTWNQLILLVVSLPFIMMLFDILHGTAESRVCHCQFNAV